MIVKSLLENDMYKFTMWQAMLHNNSGAMAEYRFLCRSTPEYPLSQLAGDLNSELDHLCTLSFQQDELDYLKSLQLFSADFIAFLAIFRFQREFIRVAVEKDTLMIEAEGPQIHVMGFEIFCLYLVSELYFRRFDQAALLRESRSRLRQKIALIKQYQFNRKHPFEFFDFGLRRRWSGAWQDETVQTLKAELPACFKGTSNVYLAKKYNLTPTGTMAHEYLQSYQASGYNLRDFQKKALTDWLKEFNGSLAIALTDTISMDAFLNDFDRPLASLYEGMRHDSSCPFTWGEKALAHYAKLNIDADTKRLVFSDGLDFPLALKLYEHFADRIKVGHGIGTHLTNDAGIKPLNIVMKLMNLNGRPVAKLSDAPGKTLCEDDVYVAYLKQIFNYAA
jgi:nicotinate phosphoribosyltransferase